MARFSIRVRVRDGAMVRVWMGLRLGYGLGLW